MLKAELPSKPGARLSYKLSYATFATVSPVAKHRMIVFLNNLLLPASSWDPVIEFLQRYHSEEIRKIGVDPTSLYPVYKPRQISSAFVPIGSSQITVVEPQTWGAYFKSWIPFTSKPQKKVSELQVPTQSEDELDALDALAPAYDQLELNSSTWAWMEDFKMEREVRSKDGKFVPVFDKHLGHGRSIPPTRYQHGGKVKVHGTVRLRMAATLKNGAKMGTSYSPLARVGYEPQFEDKMPFEKAVEKGLIEWVV